MEIAESELELARTLDLNGTKRNLTRKCLIYVAIRDFSANCGAAVKRTLSLFAFEARISKEAKGFQLSS